MVHSRWRNKSGISKTDQKGQSYFIVYCLPKNGGRAARKVAQLSPKTGNDTKLLFTLFFQLVNCPRGHFFNGSNCHACAVDQYQDQEAQISCISCPLGTTTFGEEASEKMQDCQGKERKKEIVMMMTITIMIHKDDAN